jgi:hypothetical protein
MSFAPPTKRRKRQFAPGDDLTDIVSAGGYDSGTYDAKLTDGTNDAANDGGRGYYVRIGQFCWVEFSFLLSSIGSASGGVRITMPFARDNSAVDGVSVPVSASGCFSYLTHLGAGDMQDLVAPRVDNNNDFAFLIRSAEGSAGTSLGFSDLNATGSSTIRGSICYRVAS